MPHRRPTPRLFGFLFGCVLSGGAVYSYLLQEYKASNDLLTEDIYVGLPFQGPSKPDACFLVFGADRRLQTLQASVARLANYVRNLEDKTQGKK